MFSGEKTKRKGEISSKKHVHDLYLTILSFAFLLPAVVVILLICQEPSVHQRLTFLLNKYCQETIRNQNTLYNSLCYSLESDPPNNHQLFQEYRYKEIHVKFHFATETFVALERKSEETKINISPVTRQSDTLGWFSAGPKIDIKVDHYDCQIRFIGITHFCARSIEKSEMSIFHQHDNEFAANKLNVTDLSSYHAFFLAPPHFSTFEPRTNCKCNVTRINILVHRRLESPEETRVSLIPDGYFALTEERLNAKGYQMENDFLCFYPKKTKSCGFCDVSFSLSNNYKQLTVVPDCNIPVTIPGVDSMDGTHLVLWEAKGSHLYDLFHVSLNESDRKTICKFFVKAMASSRLDPYLFPIMFTFVGITAESIFCSGRRPGYLKPLYTIGLVFAIWFCWFLCNYLWFKSLRTYTYQGK